MFNLDFTDLDQTTCPVVCGVYFTTLPDSEVFSEKSQSFKPGDGKVNTTLPAANLKKQTNDTVSPRTAQNMVTDIKEKGPSKRSEPIVVSIGHSDSEETSEIELPDLPKFSSSPFFGLNPEICSPHQQENDDVLFHGDFTDNVSEEILDTFWPDTPPEYATKGYFGIASQKTVPENHDTATSVDCGEEGIYTALGTSVTEKATTLIEIGKLPTSE